MNKVFLLILILMTANTAIANSIHTLSFKTLSGETRSFSEFKGRKILIVNTASECGFTPQYAQLEELYQTYKEELVVIGFPSNDFGNQEPGDAEEIKAFCEQNYGLSFIMAEKVRIKGDKPHPVYEWLSRKELNGVMDENVRWNFHKFVINEEGQLVKAFPSQVEPLDEKMLEALDLSK